MSQPSSDFGRRSKRSLPKSPGQATASTSVPAHRSPEPPTWSSATRRCRTPSPGSIPRQRRTRPATSSRRPTPSHDGDTGSHSAWFRWRSSPRSSSPISRPMTSAPASCGHGRRASTSSFAASGWVPSVSSTSSPSRSRACRGRWGGSPRATGTTSTGSIGSAADLQRQWLVGWQEHRHPVDRPVTVHDLEWLLDWVLDRVGWSPGPARDLWRPGDQAKRGRAGICESYKKSPARTTTPDPTILNSFFLSDLEAVRREVRGGDVGRALRQYLGLDLPETRSDVRTDTTVRRKMEHPSLRPTGRWPTASTQPLNAGQLRAIHGAFLQVGSSPGLFSVNGPPGTGKTTLLRDVVAEVVVTRAMHLPTGIGSRPTRSDPPSRFPVTRAAGASIPCATTCRSSASSSRRRTTRRSSTSADSYRCTRRSPPSGRTTPTTSRTWPPRSPAGRREATSPPGGSSPRCSEQGAPRCLRQGLLVRLEDTG